jgi:hypothetical protein
MEAFRWDTLKSILDNRAVATTNIWIFVVPIALLLTQKLPSEVEVFPWNSIDPLTLQLELPFNWYLLYFSAFLFAVARAAYIVRCPSFFRQYNSAADAISDGVSAEIIRDRAEDFFNRYQGVTLHNLSEEGRSINALLSLLISDDYRAEQLIETKEFSVFGGVATLDSIKESPGSGVYTVRGKTGQLYPDYDPSELTKLSTNVLIWRLLESQNVSSPKIRFLSSVVVVFAFLLLSISLAQGVWAVTVSFLTDSGLF